MASSGEPVAKKRRSAGNVGWWACGACLRTAVCPLHAGDVLCCAAGRAELQARLKAAQVEQKAAEKKVAGLRWALKRSGGAAASPVLRLAHGGWRHGDKGWAAGSLAVTLAAAAGGLDAALLAGLCGALSGLSLELEGCSSGMFYARDAVLPPAVLALLPARPQHELRPGAVLIDPGRQRLFVFTRRTPFVKRKDVGSCKLLGYLLQEGLDGLSFQHVPNARVYADCVYCAKTDHVAIPITEATQQPHGAGDKSSGTPVAEAAVMHKKSKKEDLK